MELLLERPFLDVHSELVLHDASGRVAPPASAATATNAPASLLTTLHSDDMSTSASMALQTSLQPSSDSPTFHQLVSLTPMARTSVAIARTMSMVMIPLGGDNARAHAAAAPPVTDRGVDRAMLTACVVVTWLLPSPRERRCKRRATSAAITAPTMAAVWIGTESLLSSELTQAL